MRRIAVPRESELAKQLKKMQMVSSSVKAIYQRLPATYPFPLDPLEVYDELMGAQFRKKLWRPMGPPKPKGDGWAREVNFRSLLTWGSVVTVSLDSMTRVADVADVRGGLRAVFWMEMPKSVPIPASAGLPVMLLPLTSKLRPSIVDWYIRAMRFARRAEHDLELIRKVIKKSRVPEVLTRVWPELMDYADLDTDPSPDLILPEPDDAPGMLRVKGGRGFSGETTQQQVQKVLKECGDAVVCARPRVANNIAIATLLPPSAGARVWVGWPME